jgi:hypothetical protein
MKYCVYLDKKTSAELEQDVISTELRVHLTRLLGRKIKERKPEHQLIHLNTVINQSRNLVGNTIYVLEEDDWGYEDAEYAWHYGEFNLVFRRLSTPQLVEYLCELINDDWFSCDELNDLLNQEAASCRFVDGINGVEVELLSIQKLEELEEEAEEAHPNVRLLIKRMDSAVVNNDPAAVVHASASVFETLAKDLVAIPSIQNQSLGSFFERYRKDSRLPSEVLDYILEIYNMRNVEPLAGHGSTAAPKVTIEQATILAEITKAFVKIEYKLSLLEPHAKRGES